MSNQGRRPHKRGQSDAHREPGILPADAPGRHGHVPTETNREPNRSQSYREAVWERVHRWTVPVATVVIAVLTGVYAYTSHRQWKAMLASNATNQENSRAFMSGDVVISKRQTGPNGDYWTILPQITNGGASSAAAVSVIVGIMIINPSEMAGHGLNESTIDPDKTEITIQGIPYATSSIPPHTTSTYGAFSVSLATVESIRDKHDVMYVAGRINYFSFNEPHVIKFCRRFYGDTASTENFALWGDRRITPFVSGNADLISRPCGRNNCADGDCTAAQ
jgi:hypothetical protein